jgi:hypothetical protein
MKQQDTYKEVRTLKFGENIVRVHIPDLTSAERERRLKDIGRLAGEMLIQERKEK